MDSTYPYFTLHRLSHEEILCKVCDCFSDFITLEQSEELLLLLLGQVINPFFLKVKVDKLVEKIRVEARVLRFLSKFNALTQVAHRERLFL